MEWRSTLHLRWVLLRLLLWQGIRFLDVKFGSSISTGVRLYCWQIWF
jgi:hypothetical protein